MEQVFIAFAREEDRNRARGILEKGGVPVRGVFRGGPETVRAVRRMGGGVVVCAARLPGMTARELAEDLAGIARVAVVAPAPELDMGPEDGLTLIPAPLTRDELISAVLALCQAGGDRRPPRRDEERELIARAKDALRARYGLDEPAAHRYLQRQSMLRGVPMVQTARQTLENGPGGDVEK